MTVTSPPSSAGPDVLVVGLGYVGLTLAAGLASTGASVVGVDVDPARVAALRRGEMPFHEPGLAEVVREALPAGALVVTDALPDVLPPATVVCVGTPVAPDTATPDLGAVRTVAALLGERIGGSRLVVVRSTVPVGTTRREVLPALARRAPDVRVAVCPERTIQGQALRELRTLPQIIGGLDPASADAAADLFAPLSPHQVRVSSLEAAETVKLVNNAHTDVIYGFGNEVALVAETLGLDAHEIITAANLDYPRPDLCRPGFVGGGCLTKDPHLLVASTAGEGHVPPLVSAARSLNESVPLHQADRLLRALKDRTSEGDGPDRVLVCGLAYKGRPATDDVRGSAAPAVIARLRASGADVVAHDPVVPAGIAADFGVPSVSLEEGFRDRDAAIVLTDHPDYAALDARAAVATMRSPAIVVDGWGVLADSLEPAPRGVTYMRYGRG